MRVVICWQGVRRMPHLNQDVEEGETAGEEHGAVAVMHKRQLQMERATECLALWARDAQSLGLLASSRAVLACYIRVRGSPRKPGQHKPAFKKSQYLVHTKLHASCLHLQMLRLRCCTPAETSASKLRVM